MLNNIPKLNGATGKIGDWAEKLSAAKATIFKQPEEIDVDFAKELLRDLPRVNEEAIAGMTSEMEAKQAATDTGTSDVDEQDRTAFLNNRVKDKVLAKWELMGENGPNDDFVNAITTEDLAEEEKPFAPPLMVGFDMYTDFVELEYMVVPDPVTGQSVAPVVDVKPSEDGKSGVVSLNGNIVACVAGGQLMKNTDVKLVRVEADPSEA